MPPPQPVSFGHWLRTIYLPLLQALYISLEALQAVGELSPFRYWTGGAGRMTLPPSRNLVLHQEVGGMEELIPLAYQLDIEGKSS